MTTSRVAIQESPSTPSDVSARDAVPLLARTEKSVFESTGGRGRLTFASLRELWVYRGVMWAFVMRQLKARYKQAAIGIGWAVLQPLLAATLFALFLGRYTGLPSEGAPYLLFALAGMAAWSFFSTATSTGSESLVANQSLLRKIYFPRELLPLSAVGASLVDLFFALVVLGVVAVLYGESPTVEWISLPGTALLLVVTAVAIALALSALNVYYRDVRYALPFLLQVGLFATPVVYPLSVVPESWRTSYAVLNPVAAAVDGFRRAILHASWPDPVRTFGALGWAILLVFLALLLFKRLERGLSDRA